MSGSELKQRLAAVLAADVAGYSRLMSLDERATVEDLDLARSVFRSHIEANHGRVIDMAGDSVLAVFETATGAVQAALAAQKELGAAADMTPADRRMQFRVGVHLGDLIEKEDGTVYGDGVNIAARLEGLAAPGGITVSESIYTAVRGKVAAGFKDMGGQTVKNIEAPVHVYRVDAGQLGADGASGTTPARPGFRGPPWRTATSVAIATVIALGAGLVFSPAGLLLRDAWTGLTGNPGSGARADRATIAVLPLTNQSGDPSRDYLSNGVTEDIINALGRFSGVTVIAHNAVQPYRGSATSAAQISRELGVRYVAQGSVRLVDDKIRVAVELADATDGSLLWSDRFEGQGRDWFEMQDRIVRSIVGALAVKLTSLELKRVKAKPVESAEAYDLVLRARELIQQSDPAANRRARQLLGRAITLSPNEADAYVYMADAENQRVQQGYVEDVDGAVQRAQVHLHKALSIDDPHAHARAHAILASTYAFQGLHEQSLAEAERAIELNPSDARAYLARSNALLWTGKIDASIAAAEATRRLDPRGWADQGFVTGMAYFTAGRFTDAIATTDSYIPRYPQYVFLRVVRAAAFAQTGRLEDAQTEVRQIRQLSPFLQVEQVGTRFLDPANAAKIQDALRKAGL